MLGISKSLGWGFFLAGSVAVFAQDTVVSRVLVPGRNNPKELAAVQPQGSVVPQGGEFAILEVVDPGQHGALPNRCKWSWMVNQSSQPTNFGRLTSGPHLR